MRKLLLSILTIAMLGTLVPLDAQAIPAFARRHKLSCTTCHDPFPRLKPFGEEFAANGFYLPEDDSDRDYVNTGDPLLRLNRTFPVAARLDAYLLFDEDDPRAETDLQTPWGLKLLSGGPVTRNVGYYFYFYMSEAGEVAGIEDAYVHFNDLFGQSLDIMVGQFQVCDPLMKRELRLTYEDYDIYKVRVGDSRTNLAYDRGIIAAYDLEATGTGLVATLVNGNGKPEAVDDKLDHDDYKNWALRLRQDILGVAAIGGFYYDGKERLGFGDNEVSYWGIDGSLGIDRFTLTAQYLLRDDSMPLDGITDVETSGWVAELVFAPSFDRSRYYVTALYNNVDSDLDDLDRETITGGITYLVARNLRLNLEYTRFIAEGDRDEGRNRASLGLVTAF
jgi:hypothetical protein